MTEYKTELRFGSIFLFVFPNLTFSLSSFRATVAVWDTLLKPQKFRGCIFTTLVSASSVAHLSIKQGTEH